MSDLAIMHYSAGGGGNRRAPETKAGDYCTVSGIVAETVTVPLVAVTTTL
jgi:hypothetical protein